MKQKELMNKQTEFFNLESEPIKKETFNKVIEVIRENLVATYIKESDTSLLIRLVSGLEFRLTIEST